MSQSIQLTQAVLGLKPYVLIEFFDGGESDEDLRATVNAGGGIASVSDIRAALALALDSLPEPEDGDHG